GLQDALEAAAREEGATTLRMPSGAGHDAMVLAHHVPAAMLFVPSRGGISHSPEEFTPPEQCELGARVLARAVRRLVESA
ncbi:MAG: M20/M25/M40 family metallo-hydrolase, partial [Gaiellaceae bacterium]